MLTMELYYILCLFIFGIFATVGILATLLVSVHITTLPHPILERYLEEESFHDPNSNTEVKFPNITNEWSVNLSVVVPAYNEEERLPPMLDEAIDFLEERIKNHPSFKYEIIIVSDGSNDNTVKVAQSYTVKHGSDKVRCLKLVKNRGKGGAVKMGVLSCRGATILFADADGASKFEDLIKLERALVGVVKYDPVTQPNESADELAVVIGSRAHLEEESLAKRSIFRNILMYGFHFLVWLFTVRGIRDTQCGFKLFTRRAALDLFQNLHVDRWAFDVELLYIAQMLNIPIVEMPIRWTEIDGSKVTPVFSWIQMGCDLALIWLRYTCNAWRITRSQKQ